MARTNPRLNSQITEHDKLGNWTESLERQVINGIEIRYMIDLADMDFITGKKNSF